MDENAGIGLAIAIVVGFFLTLALAAMQRTPKPRTVSGYCECPSCGAPANSICKRDCGVRASRMRSQNAPRCEDGLHHHCARLPYCAGECERAPLLFDDGTAHPDWAQ